MQIKTYKFPPLPTKKYPPIHISSQKIVPIVQIHSQSTNKNNSIQKQKLSRKNSLNNLRRIDSARSRSRDSLESRQSKQSSRDNKQSNYKQHLHYNLKTRISMPTITAKSWSIYQMKQQKFIYGKKTFKRKQIASLTKIMNLITILNIIQKYQLQPIKIKLKISKQASCINGTTAQLKPQIQLTLFDLFYGMMLPSGNDAAFQIAQIGGALLILNKQLGYIDKDIIYNCNKLTQYYRNRPNSILIYLQYMNKLSKQMNMINSNFANPHGLSNINNYSTADDICKLSIYSMKNQLFRQIVNTKKYLCKYTCNWNKQNINQQQLIQNILYWENTNKLLDKGWNGIKTGITPNAGPCLAASIRKNINGKDLQFIIVVINSASMQARWNQVDQIVSWVINQGLCY